MKIKIKATPVSIWWRGIRYYKILELPINDKGEAFISLENADMIRANMGIGPNEVFAIKLQSLPSDNG